MSLLGALLERGTPRAEHGPDSDFWYGPPGQISQTGTPVSPDAALGVAAVYACVKVLAEDVAKLPLVVYRNTEDGGKEKALDHPLYRVLARSPNQVQNSFEFREMLQGHLALGGDCYAQIVGGRSGAVEQLIPLHPDRVRAEELPNGRVRYLVSTPTGPLRLNQEEIFHVSHMSDGLRGRSPVSVARGAVALSSAAEGFAARFFGNDATPGGILSHPGRLNDEARVQLKKSWDEAHRGPSRAHRMAVLEEGLQWIKVGIDAQDAQLIETRKFQLIKIARLYRMPLHKTGEMSFSTYSNIEHQAIEYVTDCLLPWVVRWEQAIANQLVSDPEEYFVKFNLNALLRGDTASRYAAYAIGRQWGFLSVNDILDLEDLNQVPEGDGRLEPLNMKPLDPMLGER